MAAPCCTLTEAAENGSVPAACSPNQPFKASLPSPIAAAGSDCGCMFDGGYLRMDDHRNWNEVLHRPTAPTRATVSRGGSPGTPIKQM